jgi:hypothetical protein
MKKLMVAGLFLLLSAFAASAQNLPSIRIVNNTGVTIYFVYISSPDSEDWGDDVLGESFLEDGQTFTYQLPRALGSGNVYDLCVSNENGDSYIKWGVTVTNNAQIVFTIDDRDEDL